MVIHTHGLMAAAAKQPVDLDRKNAWRELRRSAIAFVLASMLTQPASAEPGGWQVTDDRSPLTNLPSVSAVLPSNRDLVNMIGAAQRASLVLRCSDRVLVVYVNWPEVVNYDGENFVGQPKTMAVWKIDDGPLKANLWSIANGSAAAGEFATRNALKLLSSFANANRLVVRLSGRTTQDAAFDLAGIREIAPKVAAACGLKLGAP